MSIKKCSGLFKKPNPTENIAAIINNMPHKICQSKNLSVPLWSLTRRNKYSLLAKSQDHISCSLVLITTA